MKKTVLRLFAAALAILMLIPAISCASGEKPAASEDTVSESTEETTEYVETDPQKTLDLPEFDFKHQTFKVMSISHDTLFTAIDVDKPNGEAVNDAIFNRNRKIEDELNIVFNCNLDSWNNTYTYMEKQVKAGEAEGGYDLIMLICRNAYKAALNGYLTDYEKLTYVDTDKEYYFSDVNRQFSIGGKTFFAYGAESINVLGQADALFFNKKIAENHGAGDLYQTVNNKEWTYDRLFTLAADATSDKDNDGTEFGKDVIGLIGDYDLTVPAFWISAGENLITKDADDLPVFSAYDNEKFYDIVKTSLTRLSDNSCFVFTANDGKTEAFAGNYALFYSGCVCTLASLRSMTEDYGVLPFPMYTETQGKYVTRLVDGWIHCVPNTCMDADKTGAVMQALAYYSYNTVYDAYYSQALSAKYIRDNQSVDMLKLILSTLTVDLGDTVWYESVRAPLVDKMVEQKGNFNVASTLKSYRPKIKALIKEAKEFAESN